MNMKPRIIKLKHRRLVIKEDCYIIQEPFLFFWWWTLGKFQLVNGTPVLID